MVPLTLSCLHCGSEALVRHGHAPNGKQKYRCHGCGRRRRETPTPNAYPQGRREEILHAYQERSSLCGLTRTFGISRTTVSSWIKKVAQLPPFHTTLLTPDPEDATSTTLELDELWSFVLKKAHSSWVWIALCRKTRQVVAYVLGDRSKKTCQRLWENIPSAYRQGHCFTDLWAAYAAVIPSEQHTAVGKETGETAHVERVNTTLRQRLARFVRMTLSFSRVCGDARSMPTALSLSLQSRSGYPSQMNHYLLFLFSPYLFLCAEHCQPFYLNQRLVLEEARNLKEGRCRVVGAEKRLVNPAQRLEMSKIVVTVAHKNIDLHDILHLSPGRLDHHLEIVQYLLILSRQVSRRDNAALGVAAGLPG
jgi:insertion element IS1 protein InsB